MPTPSLFARHWRLDPDVTFLNHGSFGACPTEVLEKQTEFRQQLEAEPVRFLARELEAREDQVRAALGEFIGAHPNDLALVPNATVGVNTVLNCLKLKPGEGILVTDHGYAACRNAVERVAQRTGAKVVVAKIPFPIHSSDQVLQAIDEAFTPNIRFALIDHITSPTALILPIQQIVAKLHAKGVRVLVDGAHAPGMLPLNLDALGAEFYTGNCHKWMCAPKGAAFLHVRRDWQDKIVPLVTSHGMRINRTDRSRFRLEHDWTGTHDPTPWLCIPPAISLFSQLHPGGWQEQRQLNRDLTLRARTLLCTALEIEPPAPDDMLGSMAASVLPALKIPQMPPSLFEPLQDWLWHKHAIEVPVMRWPSPPVELLRISAQIYNTFEQFEILASTLQGLR